MDSSWKHLFNCAQQVAELPDILINNLQPKRHTQLPSRFDDRVVLESTGSRMSTNDEYKVDVYLPILDSFLGEMVLPLHEIDLPTSSRDLFLFWGRA